MAMVSNLRFLLVALVIAAVCMKSATAEIWCIARLGQSDAALNGIVRELCNEGAAASQDIVHDCGPTVRGYKCFEPNTPYAHASYVINASWQRRNSRGENFPCDHFGRAMIVTKDPSTTPECQYIGIP